MDETTLSPPSDALTVERILADDTLRHRLFPVTAKRNFQAHAGVAPLTKPAAEIIAIEAAAGAEDMQEAGDFMGFILRARKTCGNFLGVKGDEVALLGPTSLGLNLVAQGLDWKAGDEVVFYPGDYPANVYPWQALEAKGVKLVRLAPEAPGKITPDLVSQHLTEKTKLVALASCHFLTGYRLDVAAIGELLHKRDILFCLDAIQSFGATQVDMTHVDFASADSHKWLLGPLGAGVFVVREAAMDRLTPSMVGSWNVRSPDFVAQPQITFEKTARRYEPGSLNLLGIHGMLASMTLLKEVGITAIEKRLLYLRRLAQEKLEGSGLTPVHSSEPDANLSGIISIPVPSDQGTAIMQRLTAHNITASLRLDASRRPHLRLSPHFYTTDSEVEEALSLILQS